MHVMLDLETLDTSPTAVVTAVGAVVFDPYSERVGQTFYRVTNDWSDQQRRGRTISGDTVRWWLEQSHEAQEALTKPAAKASISTQGLLQEFTEFLENTGGDILVWGNGADFDNVILGGLFASYGRQRPWSYRNNRCFRTAMALYPGVTVVRQGTHHNALDDALTQVHALQAAFANRRAA